MDRNPDQDARLTEKTTMSKWIPRQSAGLAILVVVASIFNSGCRTVTSLGLPVSSGTNYLLSDAVEIRQSVGHRSDLPTELAKAALTPHKMEAGDVILIEPNDFNSPVRIQSDHTIQQDGTIDLGSYGQMYVAGKTTSQIQEDVESVVTTREAGKRENRIALAAHGNQPPLENYDYGVSVRLVNGESSQIYVMGEINAPGSYPLNGNETVLDAVISAGGLSVNANEHRIIMIRPRPGGEPRIILPVCYQQILQLGDVSTNYQLQPGDRIYVPSMTVFEDLRQTLSWRNEKGCPHCIDYSK